MPLTTQVDKQLELQEINNVSTVYLKPGENFESLYRRFKRAVERSGILGDLKKHEYYEKPSVKKKRKSAAARKRELKRKLKVGGFTPNRNLNFRFNKDQTEKIPLYNSSRPKQQSGQYNKRPRNDNRTQTARPQNSTQDANQVQGQQQQQQRQGYQQQQRQSQGYQQQRPNNGQGQQRTNQRPYQQQNRNNQQNQNGNQNNNSFNKPFNKQFSKPFNNNKKG